MEPLTDAQADIVRVTVFLHSVLREKLPAEARGQTTLNLPKGALIQDLLAQFDLPAETVWAVNEVHGRDPQRILEDGDVLRFLRPGAGG